MSAMTEKTFTRAERVRQIDKLRAKGLSTNEIARRIGLARSTVYAYIHDPTGAKDTQRRQGYGRPCLDCGKLTSGGDGPAKAPLRCAACANKRNIYWTKERIIEAMLLFKKEHGRQPMSHEWLGDKPRDRRYPYTSTVLIRFGSWRNACAAAGLKVLKPGEKPRRGHLVHTTNEIKAKILAASEDGVAPATNAPPWRSFVSVLRYRGTSWKEVCHSIGLRTASEARWGIDPFPSTEAATEPLFTEESIVGYKPPKREKYVDPVPGRNRKFDWDEAKRLYDEGALEESLAVRFGVSVASIRHAVIPGEYKRHRAKQIEKAEARRKEKQGAASTEV